MEKKGIMKSEGIILWYADPLLGNDEISKYSTAVAQ
jgi:hypothetical protein